MKTVRNFEDTSDKSNVDRLYLVSKYTANGN